MACVLEGLSASELNGSVVSVLGNCDSLRKKVKLLHSVYKENILQHEEGKILSVPSNRVFKQEDDEKENIDPCRKLGDKVSLEKRSRSRSRDRTNGKQISQVLKIQGHGLKSVKTETYDSILNIPTTEDYMFLTHYQSRQKVYRQSILVQHESEVCGEKIVVRFLIFLTSSEKGAIEQLHQAAATYGISTSKECREEHIKNLTGSSADKVFISTQRH